MKEIDKNKLTLYYMNEKDKGGVIKLDSQDEEFIINYLKSKYNPLRVMEVKGLARSTYLELNK